MNAELKAALQICVAILGMAILWVILVVPMSALAFVWGRWAAKLLGWY